MYKLNSDKVSWSEFNNGLSKNYPRTLFYSSNHELFLGTLENGVYYYDFTQARWIQTKFPASLIYELETYRDDFYVCSTQKNIFLSSDKGESWDNKLSIVNGCILIYDKNTIIAGDGNYNANTIIPEKWYCRSKKLKKKFKKKKKKIKKIKKKKKKKKKIYNRVILYFLRFIKSNY